MKISSDARARAALPLLVAMLGACATAPPCPCSEPPTAPTTQHVGSATPSSPPVVTSAPTTPVAAPLSAHAIALARARVDAAENLYVWRERLWLAGSATITALLALPRVAHAAFVEGGIVGEARVAWATRNLERIKHVEAIKGSGYAGQDETAEIATARAEAEFWLEEARQSR